MQTFRAFRIVNEDSRIHGSMVTTTLDELSAGPAKAGHYGQGDVLVKASYSSVNYKDALAATGAGKILRRFPLIGGIDVAGTVAAAEMPRFREGDQVLVTGYDLGVGTMADMRATCVCRVTGWSRCRAI